MKTLQEKYNAILEGNFSKVQFVRDARLAHSNLITQFNSFADTVAILKNKGMVVEAKKAEVTAYKKPEVDPIDMVAPDLLDHGIEAELHAAGITGTPSEEEYAKAKEKAAKELIKDPLCYKNAQTMTEPGEKMEKAKLSEETALDRAEDHASAKVQDKLGDIADTVVEKPASVAAAFRKMVLANPTHYAKMSAHELEREFKKFKLEESYETPKYLTNEAVDPAIARLANKVEDLPVVDKLADKIQANPKAMDALNKLAAMYGGSANENFGGLDLATILKKSQEFADNVDEGNGSGNAAFTTSGVLGGPLLLTLLGLIPGAMETVMQTVNTAAGIDPSFYEPAYLLSVVGGVLVGAVIDKIKNSLEEGDEDQAYKDGVTQASIDMAIQQAGMKETQLKEAVKSLIKKTLES
jgi:hypothetical protein